MPCEEAASKLPLLVIDYRACVGRESGGMPDAAPWDEREAESHGEKWGGQLPTSFARTTNSEFQPKEEADGGGDGEVGPQVPTQKP